MIYKHEIPKGSRLYFSKNAKLKREIENKASAILTKFGFSEIVMPYFSYYSHQNNINENELIKISDKNNKFINLRADSTIDVTRVVTKRLQGATNNNKWFYIQPVFRFPTDEFYQIGAENISNNNLLDSIEVLTYILKEFNLSYTFQLSNTKLVELISKELDIKLDILSNISIDEILSTNKPWIKDIIYTQNINSIKINNQTPKEIKKELESLIKMASQINHNNISISPFYQSKTKYYHGAHFRLFVDNLVIAKGGVFKDEDVISSGFCIFVDNLIEGLVK